MKKLTIDNPVQMEELVDEVFVNLLNMHVVKDNEDISYEEVSKRISLIARMMWARKVSNG